MSQKYGCKCGSRWQRSVHVDLHVTCVPTPPANHVSKWELSSLLSYLYCRLYCNILSCIVLAQNAMARYLLPTKCQIMYPTTINSAQLLVYSIVSPISTVWVDEGPSAHQASSAVATRRLLVVSDTMRQTANHLGSPANTRHWANGGLILGRRRRRRANINPTLVVTATYRRSSSCRFINTFSLCRFCFRFIRNRHKWCICVCRCAGAILDEENTSN